MHVDNFVFHKTYHAQLARHVVHRLLRLGLVFRDWLISNLEVPKRICVLTVAGKRRGRIKARTERTRLQLLLLHGRGSRCPLTARGVHLLPGGTMERLRQR